MNLTSLVREVVKRTDWPRADAEGRARRLREAMMLPAGRDGTVGHDHAAILLIGLAASERVAHVVEATLRYLRLVPTDAKGFEPFTNTFGEALAAVLASEQSFLVDRVSISRTALEATIYYRDTKDGPLHVQRFVSLDDAPPRRTVARVEVQYPRAVLHQLALDVVNDVERGELVLPE